MRIDPDQSVRPTRVQTQVLPDCCLKVGSVVFDVAFGGDAAALVVFRTQLIISVVVVVVVVL
jgi:hypothetical protein